MIILITGGASGLGEAITRKMAEDSTGKVYFTFCKSAESAKKLEKAFSNAFSIKCDFNNEVEVSALAERIDEINPDVLINNAYGGSFIKSHFHKTLPADFLSEFKENIIPTIAITQAAIHCFRKKKNGKIITILTSTLADTPPIGSAVYVSNKAYLEELTKVWAAENAKFNIASNSVSPSFMQTNFTKDMDERIVEQIRENSPSKKLLTTEEVAVTVFSLSRASQETNGVNILLRSTEKPN